MTTMYRLRFGGISEFEVIKTSDKSVWFKRVNMQKITIEDRDLLKTNCHEWFVTKQDAIDSLMNSLTEKVSTAKYQLSSAEASLEKAITEFK